MGFINNIGSGKQYQFLRSTSSFSSPSQCTPSTEVKYLIYWTLMTCETGFSRQQAITLTAAMHFHEVPTMMARINGTGTEMNITSHSSRTNSSTMS